MIPIRIKTILDKHIVLKSNHPWKIQLHTFFSVPPSQSQLSATRVWVGAKCDKLYTQDNGLTSDILYLTCRISSLHKTFEYYFLIYFHSKVTVHKYTGIVRTGISFKEWPYMKKYGTFVQLNDVMHFHNILLQHKYVISTYKATSIKGAKILLTSFKYEVPNVFFWCQKNSLWF